MKRIILSLALGAVITGASGCCCCRNLWPQPSVVAAPVAAPAPVCPPVYDPCATPVTYGTAPMSGYTSVPAM
jgi:hypothetical protein